MFPHQNNMRERRMSQPPMAPQHLMGMPQQGPGMIMQMPTQQMQIMTQNHFTSQNSFAPQGQGNVSFVPAQQVATQKTSYHQTAFSHSTHQVILTKQTINRNKNYRKEYITKDSVNYNINERNNHPNNYKVNEYNINNAYNNRYHQGYNNGYFPTQVQKDIIQKPSYNSHDVHVKEKDTMEKESIVRSEKKNNECPAVSHLVPVGKEKTPMCLVNELARFNKITHQYRLTNEHGPAHKKSFTVTLTLGTEEYTADAPSIKKAQHSAAAEALAKTSFAHPTPKVHKSLHSTKSNITPTVELNALAMKRGESAIYKLLDPSQNQNVYQQNSPFLVRRPYFGIQREFIRRGRNNFFTRGGRIPVKYTYSQNILYTVSLKVGSWEFFGEGGSPQAARHDAASKALTQLKRLPNSEPSVCPVQKENSKQTVNANQDFDSLIKSPISLVHEVALRRSMSVTFEVVNERGPPHLKIFVTKCTVGPISTIGEGSKKKVSKKRSAENMLVELKKLSPLPPTFVPNPANVTKIKKKFSQTKKKSRNLIKIVQEVDTEPIMDDNMNPISKLIQIQQIKKEKEPLYTILEERGTSKKKEFLMEVSISNLKTTGTGPSKKLAKKAAAENLLSLLGYGKSEKQSIKPALKAQENLQEGSKDRKVTFIDTTGKSDNSTGGSVGRQLKPGIYVISTDLHCVSNSPCTSINMQTTATIAKELLKGGISPTADALVQKSTEVKSSSSQPHNFRPKDQLLYLADLLNFQVHFSDFPKGNHSEFLSLVTMSTDPSHVCHGSGLSIEESQDQAALTALTALSEMGLDSVTSPSSTKETKKNGKGMPSLKK